MSRRTRSDDWGFPRWRAYGAERDAAKVRLCDHDGCTQAGAYPAPKSPNSSERWHFCLDHVTDYNKRWNYFEGLSAEDAAARAHEEARTANGYRTAGHWSWSEAGPDNLTRGERDAYRALELEPEASTEQVKAAYRTLAKKYHPDAAGDDPDAARQFHAVQAAYEILEAREVRLKQMRQNG